MRGGPELLRRRSPLTGAPGCLLVAAVVLCCWRGWGGPGGASGAGGALVGNRWMVLAPGPNAGAGSAAPLPAGGLRPPSSGGGLHQGEVGSAVAARRAPAQQALRRCAPPSRGGGWVGRGNPCACLPRPAVYGPCCACTRTKDPSTGSHPHYATTIASWPTQGARIVTRQRRIERAHLPRARKGLFIARGHALRHDAKQQRVIMMGASFSLQPASIA
jgi:hypothetical protein